ncbi:uncharacterized protein LOC134209853 [Armigeres subalbatus]|uniref:uncharacterized protein LOC134209853 n=1 Tax=Armigeres subalbatus TaxID=124917 RepID=UPI002ED1CA4C
MSNSRLKASVIEDDSFNTVEQVWVSIQLGGRKLFVCAVYIPPDRTRDLELIDTHCRSVFFASEIASPNDEIIVLGDFNLAGVALLDNYSTATLSQVNCIVNENNRLLDLCFVGGRYTAPFISTAPVPLVRGSPHHPSLVIGVENDDVRDYVGTSTAVSYVFRKANYCSSAEVLSNLDWQSILDPADANIAAQTFSHVLAYARHVPKKIAHTDSRVPCLTNDLRSLKITKKAILKRFTRFRTLPLKHHYARLNHEYKRVSRFYFKRYQRRIQQRLKSHPKSFWNYVNEQRKEVGLPSSMVYNGVMASTQQEICNLFSAKFASVFVSERLSNDSITSAAGNVPLTNQTRNAVDVSADAIARAATRLKTSYKSGPDGVPSVFLKANISCLLDPLHRIFQLSLSNGVFPSCWKTAEMFPVYKNGSKRDINNYRGITSLCAVSKLYSMLACDQTDVIYTNLTAAFDKLNHSIAIAKLDRLRIGGSLLAWFGSYHTERQLTVALGDCRSESFFAMSGIPQGSHLGPLIFLLYFNDVHLVLKGPRLTFADDLKMFLRICSIADCHLLQD